jgi:Family of unknown function (DUF5335)
MALRKLNKPEWQPFCDAMSRLLVGKRAEIEVASLSLGGQVEAAWLPLFGIVYDPKNDLVEIALEGVDHMIRKPRELIADFGSVGLDSLAITDAEGTRQVVQFRDPLMLPAPQPAETQGR